jgi:hypothetical protein
MDRLEIEDDDFAAFDTIKISTNEDSIAVLETGLHGDTFDLDRLKSKFLNGGASAHRQEREGDDDKDDFPNHLEVPNATLRRRAIPSNF